MAGTALEGGLLAKANKVRVGAIRHPDYDHRAITDSLEGPLTADGQQRAEQLAAFFAQTLLGKTLLVLHSGYRRTMQLAAALCGGLRCEPKEARWLEYRPTLEQVLEACAGYEEVLLCTHLPAIRWLAKLAGEPGWGDFPIRMGEVVVFELDLTEHTLRWVGREAI